MFYQILLTNSLLQENVWDLSGEFVSGYWGSKG